MVGIEFLTDCQFSMRQLEARDWQHYYTLQQSTRCPDLSCPGMNLRDFDSNRDASQVVER